MNIDFTATMANFVASQVREGQANSRAEFIRFLVAAEIRRWERINRKPWPVTIMHKARDD